MDCLCQWTSYRAEKTDQRPQVFALNGSLPKSQRGYKSHSHFLRRMTVKKIRSLTWEEVSRSPEPCRSKCIPAYPPRKTKKRSADRARGRHARLCERAASAEALRGARGQGWRVKWVRAKSYRRAESWCGSEIRGFSCAAATAAYRGCAVPETF